MTLHVFVEGPSEDALLKRWAPRALRGRGVELRVHPHQGKGALPKDLAARPDPDRRGLLDQLPAKLRAFARSLDPHQDGLLVLVDLDDDDRSELRERIEAALPPGSTLRWSLALAIEEVEAFYLGDLAALEKAFEGADVERARKYEPDAICGTWELFGKIIDDGGGNKVAWAEAMGPVLTTNPAKSRSPSFRDFVKRLLSLVPTGPKKAARQPYRHAAKKRRSRSGRR